ncbi:MAG TPA: gliding motility-associated C-terminal domain-containing protein, partial [Chitinophagaceae bacterium]
NVTGNVNYWWVNQSGSIVAVTPDLLNMAPGSYRLKVKDGSNCDTLFSPLYSIADKGSIVLDSSVVTITPTGCTRITGSISGLKVLGATQLEWRNTNSGILVATTQELNSIPAGNYQLTAVNAIYGCTVRSSVYTVQVAQPIVIEVLADSVKDATCGNNNGSIRLIQLSNNTSVFGFRWLMDSTTIVGNGLSITGLAPATYYCIAADSNGCERSIYKKVISAKQLPVLDENNAFVSADTCGFGTGRISGITASSDIQGIQYVWRTDAGQEAGRSLQLVNIAAGDYYLTVTDARGCTIRSKKYTVPSINVALPAPRYNAVINIARFSDARFEPLDFRSGMYELYDKATGQLIVRNSSGSFVLQNVPVDRELSVQFTAGPCNSARAEILIRVFDETKLTIPNAFSPNNDGINDVFRIQAAGYFKINYLKIFNRWGQMIHESRDLNTGWDGRRNGSPLPVGTYYWILQGIDMNNKLLSRSGSLTLIR